MGWNLSKVKKLETETSPYKRSSDSEDVSDNSDLCEDSVPIGPPLNNKVHQPSCPHYKDSPAKESHKKIHSHHHHSPVIPQCATNVNIVNADNIVNLQIGSNNKISSTPPVPHAPVAVNNKYNNEPITTSTRRLDTDDFYFVAKNIPDQWKHLGCLMSFSDADLKTLELDNYKSGITEVIVLMIKRWEMNNPEVANATNLARLLQKINRSDIACKIPSDPKNSTRRC